MGEDNDEFAEEFQEAMDYSIKTERAKRIASIMKAALYETASTLPRLNFLVFGPGIGAQYYESHRVPIKEMIDEKKRQKADFPEDIDDETLAGILDSNDPTYLKKFLQNSAAKELIMAGAYDYLIIPLMSPGTFSEFSFFISNASIAQKIRLYVPSEHAESKGFLNTGPIKAFKGAYNNVKIFGDAQDLLAKVCDDVDNLITMRLLQYKGF